MHNLSKIKDIFTKEEVLRMSELGESTPSMSFIENISENVWRFSEYATKIDNMYKNLTVYFNDKLKYIAFIGNERIKTSDDMTALVAKKVLRGVDLVTKKNVYDDTPIYACSVVDYRKKIWPDFIIMKRDSRDEDSIEELRGGGFTIPSVEIVDINLSSIMTKSVVVDYINTKRTFRKKRCPILLDVDGKEDLALILEVAEEIRTLPHRTPMNKISVFNNEIELFSCSQMDIERFVKILPKVVQNIL